jgi:hypothetical protein
LAATTAAPRGARGAAIPEGRVAAAPRGVHAAAPRGARAATTAPQGSDSESSQGTWRWRFPRGARGCDTLLERSDDVDPGRRERQRRREACTTVAPPRSTRNIDALLPPTIL